MGNKPNILSYAVMVLGVVFLLAGNVMAAQKEGTLPEAVVTNDLSGKTVWIVDVNTNEYYKSSLQPALIEQLPRFAPGVVLRHVTTEKGNPFFLLKPEDSPDAVVISLGLCDASTKNVANYASEAGKKNIPRVMICFVEVRDLLSKWNKAYRNPEEAVIEIGKLPQNLQEASPVAEEIIPLILEKLKK